MRLEFSENAKNTPLILRKTRKITTSEPPLIFLPAGSDGEWPAARIRGGQAPGREGKGRQGAFAGTPGVHHSFLSSYVRRESGYRNFPDGEYCAGQYLQRGVTRGSGSEHATLLQLDWLLCVAGVSELE